MVTTKELIEKIELNKHDLTLSLRSVVSDPIEKMNNGGATSKYFEEQEDNNRHFFAKAKEIMGFFKEKWRNPNDSEQTQYASMIEKCKKVNSYMIPEITRIVDFYRICTDKKYYFDDSDSGKKAILKMQQAIEKASRIFERLKNIASLTETNEGEPNKKKYYLLELLQEVFDDLTEADVRYEDEYACSKLSIVIDKDQFVEKVLLNIRENIKNHAFGTEEYKNKHIWEKNVIVKIINQDNYLVEIYNNGSPFKGNIGKVFNYGYCHGSMRHTGIGMYSARESMRKIGGDLSFCIVKERFNKIDMTNEPCSVVYSIKLPK